MATDTKIDETHRLIASNKVEGTAVYNRQGEKLGSVYNFMVDKRSGKVEYAVMSFGGFLGMGDSYHPLPWSVLTYDTSQAAMSSTSTSGYCRMLRPTSRAKSRGTTAPTANRSTDTTAFPTTCKRMQEDGARRPLVDVLGS